MTPVRCAVLGCATLVLVGCGVVDDSVHVTERESPRAVSPSLPSDSDMASGISIDPVHVLRNDPGIPDRVRKALSQPCASDYAQGWYPLYTTYIDIPETDIPAVLINVQGCSASVACEGESLAAYVYRLWDDRSTKRVYAANEVGSRLSVEDGALELQQPVLGGTNSAECPERYEETRLTWDGEKLVAESG